MKNSLIIDGHTHCWQPEDLPTLHKASRLYDRGLEPGSVHTWSPLFDPTLDGLLAAEREAGVDRFVLLPVSNKPERCRELCGWAASAAQRHPEIIPFGTLHPYSDDLAGDAAALAETGLRGVKVHSLVQNFNPLSDRANQVYAAVADLGLPLLMDSMSLDGAVGFKPNLEAFKAVAEGWGIETGPGHIAEISRRHPGLTVIAAHLGCLYGWDRVEALFGLDRVYLDLAYIHPLVTVDQVMEIIRRKGPDRIVFGTDAPYRRPAEALAWLMDLPLSEDERTAILGGNLLRIIGG